MNIQEIRQKYPQYNELSDEQLADGLHKKFYSSLPKEDFYNRIGLTEKPQEAPPVKSGPTVLPDSDTSSDFVRGIANYLPQLQELGGAAEALTGVAASKLGAKETGKSLTESGLKTMEAGQAKAVVRESDAFLNAWEKGIGTVVTDWLPYQVGAGAANIAETLGFMGIGALAGTLAAPGGGTVAGAATGMLSKTLIKKGVKEAAEDLMKNETAKAIAEGASKKEAKELASEAVKEFTEAQTKKAIIEKAGVESAETYSEQLAKDYAKSGAKSYGMTAGMASQAGLAGMGEVGSRVFEEEKRRAKAEGREFRPEDIDMGRVLPSVAVHAVADYFFNKIGIDAMKIGEQATKSLTLDIAKRIAVTGAKQIPAEELQTLAERYGAGLSLTDKEALNEYINTAAAAVGMSVGPGAVGGARTNFEGAQKQALDKLTEELKKKTQEKSESPIVATSTVNVDGKESQKITRRDGSVEIDGVQVVPPTNKEQAADTIAPAGRNLTVSEEGQGGQTNVAPTPTVEKSPAIKSAEEYIAKIDSGEVKELSAPKLGALLDKLEIERPKGKGFREKAVQAIKDHLATQGEQNVAGTVTDTGGAGAGVAVKPSAVVAPGGTTTTQSGGVGDIRAPVADVGAGKGAQPTTLAGATPGQISNLYKEPAPLVPTTEPTKPYGEQNRPKKVEKQAPVYFKKMFPGDEGNPDPFPSYQYDPTKSEEENTKAALELQTRNEQGQEEQRVQALTDVRVRALQEQQEADARKTAGDPPKIVEFKVTAKKKGDYENTRAKLAEEDVKIPAWRNLSPLQKKIYFDFVQAATYENATVSERENLIAGRELANSIEEVGRGRGYFKADPTKSKEENAKAALAAKPTEKEQEVSFTYNRNRTEHNKRYGVSFPEWNTLSKEAKKIYTDRIGSNTGVEQDLAAAYLGLHLGEVGGKLNAAQRQKAEANIVELKRRAQTTDEERKLDSYTAGFDTATPLTEEQDKALEERAAKILEEQEKRNALPVEVLKHLRDGNLQGVLQYLRTKAKTAIHKTLAQKLFSLKLGTKIELVASLLNNDLAVYDPKSNTIFITPEGLSDVVMLHEVVHAATIKILRAFETNPKSLTDEQRDAVDHLKDIMEVARKELGDDYPDAFKNIYEFVSYAMTDKLFQNELSILSTKDLPTTLLPDNKSMWPEFVTSLSKLFDFFKNMFTKTGDIKTENLLPEVFAAFEAIVAVPEGGIEMAPLPSAMQVKGTKIPKVAPDEIVTSLDDRTSDSNALYKLKSDQKPNTPFKALKKSVTTVAGWQRLATIFQNESYPVRVLEQQLAKANLLFRTGKDAINNLHEQITLASSLARNYHNQYLKAHIEELNSAVAGYAKAAGITSEEALVDLHKVLEALHEPERRLVKYVLSVPLENTKKTLTFNGKQYTAANLRAEIVKELNSGTTTEAEARQLRKELDKVIFQTDSNGNIVYKNNYPQPNMKYVDPVGFSPSGIKETDVGSIEFKVTALDQASVDKITQQYNDSKYKEEMERVRTAVQAVHEATKSLNKIGNYWSQPVSNRVAFYGWKDYIPLKGLANQTKIDEQLDFDSRKMGRELQDNAGSMDGRFSVSRNPILQTMSDGVRSALRAGRRDLTQTVKNLLPESKLNPNGQGHLEGNVALHIPFEERDSVDLSQYKGETTIFHYNDDGSIDILVVSDPKMRNAIRRSYKRINPLIELANKITGGIGMLHTRYNYQFAPLNFVRDALTNAFTIGAEMGPREAARFLTAVATQVSAKNGLYKAMQVAVLYDKGDEKSIKTLEAMKKRDPYMKDMIEMIEQGGLVSYLQGLGLKSNFIELHKSIGKSGIITKIDDLNKFVDTWTDMFEIASRGAAYGIVKQNMYMKNLAKGMSEKDAMETAMVEAAAYTKNLANFEQVGEMGKMLGAFYMFFRPAATGAVRAIEALAPAWPGSMERAVFNLPKSIKDDEAAVKTFKENYKEQQDNARVMTGALFGLGMIGYAMAYMTADDDDLGRNAVATDNMDQWTRYLRFHIPRKITEEMGLKVPVVIQIPWGFGLGAFAAAGAQIAAMTSGHIPVTKALSNIFTSITLDSFIPIPISKMPATEMPLEFLLDSIAPSVTRPLLEFALNKNGMGQAIYNDQNRRMGDAYTGGDKIPELYKDVSRGVANSSIDWFTGVIDVSPNTLYFLSNSYIDGIGRILETAYGMPDIVKGEKSFNPKTDLPLFGSFFGAKSNVDSREFSAVEKKIADMERKINMFSKADPMSAIRYDMKNPFDRMLVHSYNQQLNSHLNPLREQAKKIRLMDLPPNTRDSMLKIINFQENLVKRNMIEQYKAYGLTPN